MTSASVKRLLPPPHLLVDFAPRVDGILQPITCHNRRSKSHVRVQYYPPQPSPSRAMAGGPGLLANVPNITPYLPACLRKLPTRYFKPSAERKRTVVWSDPNDSDAAEQ